MFADLYENSTRRELSDGSIEWLTMRQKFRERTEAEVDELNLELLAPEDSTMGK